MIRLLDLIPDIENRVSLNELTGERRTDHDLDRMVETFVRETLGVSGSRWAYHFDLDDEGLDFEDTITVRIKHDPDDMGSWRRLGWDVAGTDGQAMRALPLVAWAILVVVGGKADTTTMEIEAQVWAKSRPEANSNASPERKRQNAAFLNLGGARRRPA